jgi:uncharacterized repeat protein (TIGR03803 family)
MKQITWGLFRFAGRQAIIGLLCVAGAICLRAQTVTSLFSFDGDDGAEPDIVLTQGRDGALYGMAGAGGLNNAGTVFRFDPTTGALTTLYNFCSQPGCTDGANAPLGGGALALGTDGNFYGATSLGGLYSGCNQPGQTNGTIFKITPAGVLTTLHSFNTRDGGFPNGLVQGTDGNFYGTTQQCGKNPGQLINAGTFFKMTRSGKLTTLYNFCSQPGCADGGTPGMPIQAADGNFYGITFGGGPSGGGVVYKITPKGKYTVLADIGGSPSGALVQASDGSFYGTQSRAHSAFKMTPDGTVTGLGSVGDYPYAGLALATDQNFYGTAYGSNTLFEISSPDDAVRTLYTFCLTDCSDGNAPLAGLMQATNGTLYGLTMGGGGTCSIFGGAGCGTIYALDMGLGPFVEALTYSGKVGKTIEFLGQGFDKSSTVSFNGVTAKRSVKSGNYLTAKVPVGATTGYVTITTKSGTLTSNKQFNVIP